MRSLKTFVSNFKASPVHKVVEFKLKTSSNHQFLIFQRRFYASYKFKPCNNKKINVFIKKQRSNGLQTVDCIVCGNFLVYGVDPFQHVKGHKHTSKLKELEKSSIWRMILDITNHSLVGLEYLVELVRTPEVEILHVCMLCGFNGNACNVLEHFKNVEHQKKFLVKKLLIKQQKLSLFALRKLIFHLFIVTLTMINCFQCFVMRSKSLKVDSSQWFAFTMSLM